jgi:hypothetical protein
MTAETAAVKCEPENVVVVDLRGSLFITGIDTIITEAFASLPARVRRLATGCLELVDYHGCEHGDIGMMITVIHPKRPNECFTIRPLPGANDVQHGRGKDCSEFHKFVLYRRVQLVGGGAIRDMMVELIRQRVARIKSTHSVAA